MAISAERVLQRVDALAQCSSDTHALTRLFLSQEHRAAAHLVAGWMTEAAMGTGVDAIGNVIGRYEAREPRLPCLMLGSHLDTVRDAGKYDGMLGVVAAIECVDELRRSRVRLPFAIEVIGFADEEGARFQATLLGSRAVAGTFDASALDARDAEGRSMAQALRDFGLDPARIASAARSSTDVHAYVELHIEQGPVLEAEGLPVGIVTAINGATRFAVEITGMAGHAGTVPMPGRRDALAGAAEAVLAIARVCGRTPELVGTVGTLAAMPGAANVIPGTARFSIDLRSPRDADRKHAESAIRAELASICARRGLELAVKRTHENAATQCAPWLMDQLGAAVAAAGYPVRRLASGAGHDAMAMRDLTDVAMLFVACERGISHNPREAVKAADVAAGCEVLLRFIQDFQPRGPTS